MSAATKVTIAVVVLFAALLGVYYGFGRRGQEAAPEPQPPAEPAEAQPADEPLPAPQGVLTSSVEQAIDPDPAAEADPPDFGVLASDGTLPSRDAEPAPSEDLWVIGPRPAYPPAEPEPAADPPAAEAGQYVQYTVREGDSLWTIADDRLGDPGRWGLIADANPAIDPDRLRVGQRIRIPADPEARRPHLNAPARLPAPAPGERRAASYYTVRSGDTLSGIAQRQYRDAEKWRAIYDANRTTIGADPDRLEVGMRLRLPPA
jgi:nucleoid-associated protein YgaU